MDEQSILFVIFVWFRADPIGTGDSDTGASDTDS